MAVGEIFSCGPRRVAPYYTASSLLAPRAGNQILRCNWLPERARWSYLTRSGLPAVSRKKKISPKPYNKSFIDDACSVKMA